jgi:hypothetical protein
MTLFIKQVTVLGLKSVLANHDSDREICNTLNSYFDNQLELIEESDPLKVKGIIGDSKAIGCSKFNNCVSALSLGTLNLGTSWPINMNGYLVNMEFQIY